MKKEANVIWYFDLKYLILTIITECKVLRNLTLPVLSKMEI